MKLAEFLQYINDEEIPPEPPDDIAAPDYLSKDIIAGIRGRERCCKAGMWAIVDRIWTKELATWIGKKKVLEIMAGAGWLAKALSDCGVEIIATDDFSWVGQQHQAPLAAIYPVKQMDAIQAVREIKADILLISWPPYTCSTINRVCEIWGSQNPIIYIGEDDGGCNAPEEFFTCFEIIDDSLSIPSWPCIHDRIFIGYWQGVE